MPPGTSPMNSGVSGSLRLGGAHDSLGSAASRELCPLGPDLQGPKPGMGGTPVIPAPGEAGEEDCGLETSLGKSARPILKMSLEPSSEVPSPPTLRPICHMCGWQGWLVMEPRPTPHPSPPERTHGLLPGLPNSPQVTEMPGWRRERGRSGVGTWDRACSLCSWDGGLPAALRLLRSVRSCVLGEACTIHLPSDPSLLHTESQERLFD